MCRQVADLLGCNHPCRILVSAQVASPCLAGAVHPTVLLPGYVCEPEEKIDLRTILAHELAHLRGCDLAWNLACQVTSILLWFHPLAWRLRAAHAGACESVCDAVAADLLNHVPAYNRTLARLALQVEAAPPAASLAMARISTVRRRILAAPTRGSFACGYGSARLSPRSALELCCAQLSAAPDSHFANPSFRLLMLCLRSPIREPQAPPTTKITGQVLLHGAFPVAGIAVGLATREVPINTENGRLPRDGKFPRTTTATDGTFTLDAPAEKFMLVTSGDEGYMSIRSEYLANNGGRVTLIPWGVLMGHVILGGKPVADHEVGFVPGGQFIQGPKDPVGFGTELGYKTTTNKNGKFVFKNVPRGGIAFLPMVTELGGGKTERLRCWPMACGIKSDRLTEITLGGTGRPVTGMVTLEGKSDAEIDWTKNALVELTLQPEPNNRMIFPPPQPCPPPYCKICCKT